MMQRGTAFIVVAMTGWGLWGSDAGAAGAAATNRMTTASGRFVVAGPDAAATLEYGRWAEDQASRLERLLAERVPRPARGPIGIHVNAGGANRRAVGVSREGEECFGILSVNEGMVPEYDLIQGGLCALMIEGLVVERRRVKGRSGDAAPVPEWLSMGLAQNLAAETRSRNRKIVTEWAPRSERPSIDRVLGWASLPEGWPRNRALCGMAVLWLASGKDGVSVYGRALDRLARGEPVGLSWALTLNMEMRSADGLERAWQAWLDRQNRTIQEFGALSSALVDHLRAELDLIVPGAVDGQGGEGEMPRRLPPSDVLGLRDRPPYVRALAGEKAQTLRALSLGKAKELVEAAEAYGRFYEGIANGAWGMTTRSRLKRAEAELDRLAALTRAREAYLDDLEQEYGGAPETAGVEPILEKGPIEAYLDDVEMRSRQPARDKGAD